MPQLRWGSRSTTGNYRENNEDRCQADPQGRYFLVADGMGGQAAGEKASELALELISGKLEQRIDFEKGPTDQVLTSIDEAVAHANLEIMALGNVEPNFHNMGTTISFIVAVDEKLYVGGVGDSRVYRLRGDRLDQLTTDHSLTQALLEAGTITEEQAKTHRYRNVLVRYLGTKEGGTGTNATQLRPESGDRFLICSDGVTDGLEAPSLAELLGQKDDPQASADAIVKAAEAGGSKDNITCIVVHVE